MREARMVDSISVHEAAAAVPCVPLNLSRGAYERAAVAFGEVERRAGVYGRWHVTSGGGAQCVCARLKEGGVYCKAEQAHITWLHAERRKTTPILSSRSKHQGRGLAVGLTRYGQLTICGAMITAATRRA